MKFIIKFGEAITVTETVIENEVTRSSFENEKKFHIDCGTSQSKGSMKDHVKPNSSK